MDYLTLAKNAKKDSFKLAALDEKIRNLALTLTAKKLTENKELIFAANDRDMEKAKKDHLPAPIIGRLKFDQHKLDDCVQGIHDLIDMEDPLGKELLKRSLSDDLTLIKTTCPIGVIGVIFESRPDALIQIASLCIKSGNCSILKGGSEAMETNMILFDTIKSAGLEAGLPENFSILVKDRRGVDELLKCHGSIDLIIPRGSNAFVRYIMDNSQIPVMGHSDGICHIYVDEAADINKAVPVIIDSKTQYAAACNAAETLLVHRNIADVLLPHLVETSGDKITFKGEPDVMEFISCLPATDEDFKTEYLDTVLSIKIVDSVDEAIDHINSYGSHHTDCIITEDKDSAEKFMANVDSAGVYQNCSTRFADGFRYGFGAEVGISTGKLHARGPVGLDGLVTYKYKLLGNGQIVEDFACGKKHFDFKDIK